MKINLVLIAVLTFSPALLTVSVRAATSTWLQDNISLYVWEFKTRTGEINNDTKTITREFEEAIIRNDCFKVLERRRYAQLFSQRENEKNITSLNSLPASTIDTLRSIQANAVVFGEVFYNNDNGYVTISVSIESFSSQLIAGESVSILRKYLYDPDSLEKAVIDLEKKVTEDLQCVHVEECLKREFESKTYFNIGKAIGRGNASGEIVHGQFGCGPEPDHDAKPGSIEFAGISVPAGGDLLIRITYSKNSPETTPIQIFVNEEGDPRASFTPKSTGDWNKFTSTGDIMLGTVSNGIYKLTFYTEGQKWGVADLDRFVLCQIRN